MKTTISFLISTIPLHIDFSKNPFNLDYGEVKQSILFLHENHTFLPPESPKRKPKSAPTTTKTTITTTTTTKRLAPFVGRCFAKRP